MKTSAEPLSPTRVKLTIEVPFEEFKPSLDRAYKTIGSQIQVPGFRKGKVPPVVVDQRVGRSVVLDEALNSNLSTWYQQALLETRTTPLGQPEMDLTKFADGEDIEIVAEVDARPRIDLPDLTGISVEVDDANVTDEDVNEQLENLQQSFATHTEVERPAAEGDSVAIDLSAADKDGNAIEEAQANGLPYVIGQGKMIEGLDDALIGLEKGASKTFATTLVGGGLEGQEVDVTVTLNEVREADLPPLDDELAQMASPFDTFEELRADLVERLTRGKRMEQAAQARDLVLEKVVGDLDVPLPEGFLESEVSARREQMDQQLAYAGLTIDNYLADEEKTLEEFETELEKNVRDSIVAQFVLDQLVEDGDYSIDNDELSAHIMRRAQESGEDPNAYVQHIMEHNHVPEMIAEVLRGKALAELVENASVTDASGNKVELANLKADGSIADDDAEEAESVDGAETVAEATDED